MFNSQHPWKYPSPQLQTCHSPSTNPSYLQQKTKSFKNNKPQEKSQREVLLVARSPSFTSKRFLSGKCPDIFELSVIPNFLRVHLHCDDCRSKRHLLSPVECLAWVRQHGAGTGHTGERHTARARAAGAAAVPAGELRKPTETHGLAKVKYLNLEHGNF